MLAKSVRLNLKKEFARVKKNSVSFSGLYFTLLVARGEGESMFGFVVSSKVGSIVRRNRIRRLLTEAVRGNLEKFPKGRKYIFIGKKEALDTSHEKISLEFDKILPRIFR
ncbi:MAG: ribonuclease P protein component [Candidatus Woykebacteria bacterium RBG_13_40_7b]|uniref:Ribonuclease P protein component n=1 Tax=Candidatus Woykebacteria bacterium RBG_13_40_7b TaxID=1802594 RepID=A0A1G1WBV7_9BACT|nr:MAG: ribonuclease P protein component [Candidatus Woykebacteria bacterium RBG_13_40_7b]